VKSPGELTQIFRTRGLKVTPQRQCIFRALYGSEAHPSAESVFASVSTEMPTISLRTVYQTLNDLTAMGELAQIDLGTGSSRFDPNLDPHQHLVCERCGEVRDVHADMSTVHLPAAAGRGFRVSSTEIVFRGVCAECAATPADR